MELPIVEEDVTDEQLIGLGILGGATLGSVLGTYLDDITRGMTIGIAVGVSIAFWLRQQRRDETSTE